MSVVALGPNNTAINRTFDQSWGEWEIEDLPNPQQEGEYSPLAICSWGPERSDIFVNDGSGTLWHQSLEGQTSKWESLGGALSSAPSAACWGPGRIDVLAQGPNGTLVHKWFQKTWSALENFP